MKNKVGTAIVTAALGAMGSAASAIAADWDINPYIEIQETYTDDVDLDSNLPQSDFVTQATVGTNIVTVGPRFDLNLNYGLTHLFYPSLEGDEKSEFRHNLLADSQSVIVRDLVFFDASAGITQQFIDRRSAFTNANTATTDNRATVTIIDASPYVQNRLNGNFATLETRYRYNYVRAGESVDFDGDLAPAFSSQFHTASVTLASGTRFTRLTWALDNVYRNETSSAGRNNNIYSSVASSEYQINRELAAIGSIGYSKRDANVGGFENFSGLVWTVGARLTPGPRTLIEGTYGRDFIGNTWNFNASYRVTPFITATVGYFERFQSFAEIALANLQDGGGGGLQQNPINDDFVRQKEWRGTVIGVRGRSSISFTARRIASTSEDPDTTFVRESFGMVWTRQLSPRLDLSIGGNLFQDDFVLNPQRDQFISGTARLDYQVSQNITGALEFIHSRRKQVEFDFVPRKSNYISLLFRYTF